MTAARMQEIFRAFRDLEPGWPTLRSEILMLIAAKPGLTQAEIARRVGSTAAQTSRTIANCLMRQYGLVRQEDNPQNHVSWTVYLSAKGQKFVDDLLKE